MTFHCTSPPPNFLIVEFPEGGYFKTSHDNLEHHQKNYIVKYDTTGEFIDEFYLE